MLTKQETEIHRVRDRVTGDLSGRKEDVTGPTAGHRHRVLQTEHGSNPHRLNVHRIFADRYRNICQCKQPLARQCQKYSLFILLHLAG